MIKAVLKNQSIYLFLFIIIGLSALICSDYVYSGPSISTGNQTGVSGVPGGSDGQIQYNDAGTFNGTSSVTVSGSKITVSEIEVTGLSEFPSSAYIDAFGDINAHAAHLTDYVRVGSTSDATAGNIQWDGTNFKGYNGASWKNFDNDPTSPAGADTQVQYNSSGVLAGDAAFTYDGAGTVTAVNLNLSGNYYIANGKYIGIEDTGSITYATWNPSDKNANLTLSNGNLTYTQSSAGFWYNVRSTVSVTSGKWYWELTIGGPGQCVGIANSSETLGTNYVGSSANGWSYRGSDGKIYNSGSGAVYGNTFGAADVIGIAYDADNGKIYFSKNGVWQNSSDPAAGTNPAYSNISDIIFAMNGSGNNNDNVIANFGASAFTYTVPTGYNDGLYSLIYTDPQIAFNSATDTINVTGDVYGDDIHSEDTYITEYLIHEDDADTYFGYDAADSALLLVGNESFIDVTEDDSQDIIEIGDDGDIDIKLSGGSDGALTVQGSDGFVGIGTTTPSQELDIIGDIELENTTSSDTGVIYKGNDRFIHNFRHPTGDSARPDGSNTFIGVGTGNFTMGSTATETFHASANIGIGDATLTSLTTGNRNTVVGYLSGASINTGGSNTIMGFFSFNSNTSGDNNTGIGSQVLFSNTEGLSNTAVGSTSMASNQTGNSNVAVGNSSLYYSTSNNNTAVGSGSLSQITSGSGNTAIGYTAGQYYGATPATDVNQTSSNSIYIGADSRASADGNTNETVIGLSALGKGSNTVTIGNTSVTDNYFTGDVKGNAFCPKLNALGDLGGGSDAIDFTAGSIVTATVSTAEQTLTFTNPPSEGYEGTFKLILTNGGSQTVNWPASVDWVGGTGPSLTAAGVDILEFTTVDGGTTWYGFVKGLDMK